MLILKRSQWTVFHGILQIVSQYTHKPVLLGKCVYQDNTRNKWDIQWHIMIKCYITVLVHAIENKQWFSVYK